MARSGFLAIAFVLSSPLLIAAPALAQAPAKPDSAPASAPASAPSRRASRSTGNACVDCHQALFRQDLAGRNYLEWKGSRHAEEGVTCDQCHGGDPKAETAELAHAGMTHPEDPKSPLYKTNIPELCGGCHQEELASFKTSRHFRDLMKGRGPNCVTCHGKIAARVPAPGVLMTICEACHNNHPDGVSALKPAMAGSVYHAEELLLSDIRSLRSDIQNNPHGHYDVRQATLLLNRAQDVVGESGDLWHTFDVAKIEQKQLDAKRLIENVNDMTHPVNPRSKTTRLAFLAAVVLIAAAGFWVSMKYSIRFERRRR